MKKCIYKLCDDDITKDSQLSRTISCRFVERIGKSELIKIQNQGGLK